MNRLVVLVLVALTSRVAHADMNPLAREHYLSGNDHFANNRFSDALDAYHAAYTIDPDPDILFAIAQTERKLGRCDLALPHFREYLASRPDFPPEVQSPVAYCWRQLPEHAEDTSLPWYKNPASGAVIVGAAGLAVGVAFLFKASSTRDQADHEQFSDDFDRRLHEATGQRRIGATFLIAGALVAGGGVAYHYWTKARTPRPTTALVTDGRSILFARSF